MTPFGADAAVRAADVIREAVGLSTPPPNVAVVLGSGLDTVTAAWQDRAEVPYESISGFPRTTVPGHEGRVLAGRIAQHTLIAFSGRAHLYEGHSPAAAGFVARVASALGVRALLVINAAGGIRDSLEPGDLMVIDDHINFSFRNPLHGAVERGDARFPDMLGAYDAALASALASAEMGDGGRGIRRGVYASVLGPSYETPAEIRMLATLGADAVGMSTVPEVLVARACGLRVAGISVITNRAAGTSASRLSHDDVLRVASSAASRLAGVIKRFIETV